MHADLVRLLDLQERDAVLADAERRVAEVGRDETRLEEGFRATRATLDHARRANAEGVRLRDALETKIEAQRRQQERRKLRLDQVHNQREASAVMAELDLAGSAISQEESDWVKAAEVVSAREERVREQEAKLAEVEAALAPERASLAQRRAEVEAERDTVRRTRDERAAEITKPLRVQYERLRGSRIGPVIVALRGGACGACHTAVPLSRRGQIRNGRIIDSCEGCGAILYPSESDGTG
ncbi:MAG: hypothetical protein H0W67_05620 [Gemmatimonadales bacterium]|nr:hypothetical protein [Gemmatimonadales bacterium]